MNKRKYYNYRTIKQKLKLAKLKQTFDLISFSFLTTNIKIKYEHFLIQRSLRIKKKNKLFFVSVY